MDSMDTSKLCRSCMKEVASWERENFDIRAVEMFCFCTNMKITNDDKLPRQFCYDCIIKIESSFTFITEAQKVDAVLKNIISRTNTSVIVKQEPKSIELRLKLPDYKVSATIDKEQVIFDKDLKSEIDDINVEIIKNEVNSSIEERDKQDKHKEGGTERVCVEEIKKHICPLCRKQFTSKSWFNKHIEKEHNGPKLVCKNCQKSFSKKWELIQHSACHTEERKYSCTECGKCFKRRKQLTTHARAHSDLRPFECDKCGMKFKFKSVLKTHVSLHEGDKPFLCYFCGWSFARAGNLEVHMRKHTGDKPYSCNECNFRSSVASSLKRHQRIHRLARIYVCKDCNKGFYDASGLARHARTHTGELPFQCPGCSRAFADSWKRKSHLMRAHRLALHDIPRMHRDGRTIH
ncbi:unnamed protein product [Arctia plantaginis]|uniref:Uncharacterized protein n=1 Tax=Arctia plantaginis TaxID=874455 RepID=A0A8S1BIU5_ARCPL|nr:unnamed protein product [Arctia plantaginis]